MSSLAPQDRIQTPRRMVFDWFGTPGREAQPGDYMRAPTGRTYLVLSAREVRVRVTRGETLRQSLEVIHWVEEAPDGARIHDFHPYPSRKRRKARS